MIKLESSERIKGTFDNVEIDWDRYNIEICSPYSTKEYSVNVDFISGEISGDCIKYGSRYILETDECVELLQEIVKNNTPLRDFSLIMKNTKQL